MTSLKDECFPSKERPLLGGKEKKETKQSSTKISVRIR
jgi:hypothetical protein